MVVDRVWVPVKFMERSLEAFFNELYVSIFNQQNRMDGRIGLEELRIRELIVPAPSRLRFP